MRSRQHGVTSLVSPPQHIFVTLLLVAACLIACARAQNNAQVSDLCGTSNMQNFASSSAENAPAARLVGSPTCRPDLNGFLVDIFNGVQAIDCPNIGNNNNNQITQTTFSVFMSCTGRENDGRGVTGSLYLTTNDTTNTATNSVTIPIGITKKNLLVRLHNTDQSVSGRICTLQLTAELFAKDPDKGTCVTCYEQPANTATVACGSVGDDDDDTIWNTTAFWDTLSVLVFIFIVMVAVIIDDIKRQKVEQLIGVVSTAKRRGDGLPPVSTVDAAYKQAMARYNNSKPSQSAAAAAPAPSSSFKTKDDLDDDGDADGADADGYLYDDYATNRRPAGAKAATSQLSRFLPQRRRHQSAKYVRLPQTHK